jgi:hypothetical protein
LLWWRIYFQAKQQLHRYPLLLHLSAIDEKMTDTADFFAWRRPFLAALGAMSTFYTNVPDGPRIIR